MGKEDNKVAKKAKKANISPKKGRTLSFATFVRNNSGNMYRYVEKRDVLRIKDGSVWRDAKEDGALSSLVRKYKAFLAK